MATSTAFFSPAARTSTPANSEVTPSSSSSMGRNRGSSSAHDLVRCFDQPPGTKVILPKALNIAGRTFLSLKILREFRTKSRARLVQMEPGPVLFVVKFENLSQEYAVMAALRQVNRLWQKSNLRVGQEPVQAQTFGIFPLASNLGFVEVVSESRTLRELSEGVPFNERQWRVLRALNQDANKLDRLAASVCAYLTSSYVLGIRDGHDDNLMLRRDGRLFRVDFGFAFGRTPEIDAPGLFVPNAVYLALGEARWRQVVASCKAGLRALATTTSKPPGWDCLVQVPELKPLLPEVHDYAKSLSYNSFDDQVEKAADWTLQRAAKNTLREALRYVTAEQEVEDNAWLGLLDPFGLLSTTDPAKRATASAGGFPTLTLARRARDMLLRQDGDARRVLGLVLCASCHPIHLDNATWATLCDVAFLLHRSNGGHGEGEDLLSAAQRATLELVLTWPGEAQVVHGTSVELENDVVAALQRLGCKIEQHGTPCAGHLKLPLYLPDLGLMLLCLQDGVLNGGHDPVTDLHRKQLESLRGGHRLEVLQCKEWRFGAEMHREQELILRQKSDNVTDLSHQRLLDVALQRRRGAEQVQRGGNTAREGDRETRGMLRAAPPMGAGGLASNG
eukprot:symbB.v1.2.000014.t1/scaffold5.1/size591573/14